MSNQVTLQIESDLTEAFAAISAAADRLATARADQIAVVSGGAIEATAAQRETLRERAVEELTGELRERLRDVARAYATSISQ